MIGSSYGSAKQAFHKENNPSNRSGRSSSALKAFFAGSLPKAISQCFKSLLSFAPLAAAKALAPNPYSSI